MPGKTAPVMVPDAMKRQETKTNKLNLSKPVDLEFWDFLNDKENLNILRGAIRSKLPDNSLEDPDDIITRIKLKYSGGGKFRPYDLHRGTLFEFANRQVLDYIREIQAVRRGGGQALLSLDELEAFKWLQPLSTSPQEIEVSSTTELLVLALSEVIQDCYGKQLIVVRSLLSWLKKGCRSESWCDELSAGEVEEFLALKKGKSLEGKASATFSKVKGVLRGILVEQGFREN